MLKVIPFANAFAVASVVLYLALWILGLLAPSLFQTVYNAQFLGANVASLYSSTQNIGVVIGTLLVVGLTAWVMGYIVAYSYNRMAK